jgi:hypothetical protein
VEGFPEILVHATSSGQAEADLASALAEHLKRQQYHETTWLDLHDFPTVRVVRLYLSSRAG